MPEDTFEFSPLTPRLKDKAVDPPAKEGGDAAAPSTPEAGAIVPVPPCSHSAPSAPILSLTDTSSFNPAQLKQLVEMLRASPRP